MQIAAAKAIRKAVRSPGVAAGLRDTLAVPHRQETVISALDHHNAPATSRRIVQCGNHDVRKTTSHLKFAVIVTVASSGWSTMRRKYSPPRS